MGLSTSVNLKQWQTALTLERADVFQSAERPYCSFRRVHETIVWHGAGHSSVDCLTIPPTGSTTPSPRAECSGVASDVCRFFFFSLLFLCSETPFGKPVSQRRRQPTGHHSHFLRQSTVLPLQLMTRCCEILRMPSIAPVHHNRSKLRTLRTLGITRHRKGRGLGGVGKGGAPPLPIENQLSPLNVIIPLPDATSHCREGEG